MFRRGLMFLFAAAAVLPIFVTCDEGYEPQSNVDGQVPDMAGITNTVTEVMAWNDGDHEDTGDYTWDKAEVISIELNGNSISVDATGALVEGSKVTVISSGTYSITGSLSDGQVVVNTGDKEVVRLILSGADINCSYGAPINIIDAKKTIIVLADNSENHISDGDTYIFEDAEEDEPNAAIFSKADLTFYGNGSLTVEGNFNDGITSKDGLIIRSGTITVDAADDGIRGKDYLIIRGGSLTVNAGGDGLKSDNDEDISRGYILVETGVINIASQGDAVTAETDLLISDGEINIFTGGGSNSQYDENTSVKGLKAGVGVVIDGGDITINSADDAIHSNNSLAINGGEFILSTGDDGVHADTCLGINGGDISIVRSYEGLESELIIINYGNIHIISGDDGINTAGGDGGDGMNGWPPGGPGGPDAQGDYYLYINGGYIAVNADGDGIDANGPVVMTDGEVIIHGPTSNGNGALDHASFKITGGFLLAAGSSGMAQAPGTSSSQYSVLLNLRSSQQAGTMVHVQTTAGVQLFSFKPAKKYQSAAFSVPELKKGSSYNIYLGGSSSGTAVDGLYEDGTYTPGTLYTSFTVSGMLTQIR